jgi:hypothetical protein
MFASRTISAALRAVLLSIEFLVKFNSNGNNKNVNRGDVHEHILRRVDILSVADACADQSVERRRFRAPSGLAGSGFVSDLTGSILALSTGGVSTRALTSTEPVCSGARSERGRATARAINICAARAVKASESENLARYEPAGFLGIHLSSQGGRYRRTGHHRSQHKTRKHAATPT